VTSSSLAVVAAGPTVPGVDQRPSGAASISAASAAPSDADAASSPDAASLAPLMLAPQPVRKTIIPDWLASQGCDTSVRVANAGQRVYLEDRCGIEAYCLAVV
jgi:hypothetical protein